MISQSTPGSMMPGMPGLLLVTGKIPGSAPLMPNFISGVDSEGWEYSVSRKNKSAREGLMSVSNT